MKDKLLNLSREMFPEIPLDQQVDLIREFEDFKDYMNQTYGGLRALTLADMLIKDFKRNELTR